MTNKEKKYSSLFIRFMKEHNVYEQYFNMFKQYGTYEKVIHLCVTDTRNNNVFETFECNDYILSTPFTINWQFKKFSNSTALGVDYNDRELKKEFKKFLKENYK